MSRKGGSLIQNRLPGLQAEVGSILEKVPDPSPE